MTITTPGADDIPEWKRRTKESLAKELALTRDELRWRRDEDALAKAKMREEAMAQMHHVLAHTIRKFKEVAADDPGGDHFIQLLDHIQDEVTAAQGGSAFKRKGTP